jgi:hypothetical protein
MGIIDFRGLRGIGTPSEVALHRSKTLISGLFKQPLKNCTVLADPLLPLLLFLGHLVPFVTHSLKHSLPLLTDVLPAGGSSALVACKPAPAAESNFGRLRIFSDAGGDNYV